jgi:hypothetical protein
MTTSTASAKFISAPIVSLECYGETYTAETDVQDHFERTCSFEFRKNGIAVFVQETHYGNWIQTGRDSEPYRNDRETSMEFVAPYDKCSIEWEEGYIPEEHLENANGVQWEADYVKSKIILCKLQEAGAKMQAANETFAAREIWTA